MRESNREASRRKLYDLLGDLPPRNRPVSAVLQERVCYKTHTLETLQLDLNGEESVPAYLALPELTDGRPCPVVLYSHAHGGDYGLGKDELLHSRKELLPNAYLEDLVGCGYAVLCIDHWLFGKRSGRDELDLFKEMLWRGRVLWGMMVYDSLKATDYITTREEIDANRIGALGLSMGSTMTWWLAALDARIKVGVDLCCLTDFEALIAHHSLREHSMYYYVPGLLKHFSTADICALAAPRARLALAGRQDPLTPPDGLVRIDTAMRELYGRYQQADKWRLDIEDVAHEETSHMRTAALDFLRTHL